MLNAVTEGDNTYIRKSGIFLVIVSQTQSCMCNTKSLKHGSRWHFPILLYACFNGKKCLICENITGYLKNYWTKHGHVFTHFNELCIIKHADFNYGQDNSDHLHHFPSDKT